MAHRIFTKAGLMDQTKECRSCREEISARAKKCPHCATSQKSPVVRGVEVVVAAVVIGWALIAIISALGNSAVR